VALNATWSVDIGVLVNVAEGEAGGDKGWQAVRLDAPMNRRMNNKDLRFIAILFSEF